MADYEQEMETFIIDGGSGAKESAEKHSTLPESKIVADDGHAVHKQRQPAAAMLTSSDAFRPGDTLLVSQAGPSQVASDGSKTDLGEDTSSHDDGGSRKIETDDGRAHTARKSVRNSLTSESRDSRRRYRYIKEERPVSSTLSIIPSENDIAGDPDTESTDDHNPETESAPIIASVTPVATGKPHISLCQVHNNAWQLILANSVY